MSVIAAVSFLTGCFPTGTRQANNDTTLAELQARADKLENLTLDLDLPDNTPDEMPELKLTARSWDESMLKKLFLDGKTITAFYEYPGWYNEEFGESYYYYETADNHVFLYETGRFFDKNKDEDKYSKYGIYSIESLNNILRIGDILTAKELEGFSPSDAEKMAEDIIEKIGIKNYGKPEITAINSEDANKLYSIQYKPDSSNDIEVLPKEKEFYLLRYPLMYEGYILNEWETPISIPNKTVPASYINVIAVKDEIVSVEIRGVYNDEYETGENIPIKFKASDILETIVSRYEKTVNSKQITISDIKLVYAANMINGKEYNFIPVWQVDFSTHDAAYGCGFMHREYYNARTGNALTGG